MVRPVEDEMQLGKLNKMSFSEYRKEFQEKAKILK